MNFLIRDRQSQSLMTASTGRGFLCQTKQPVVVTGQTAPIEHTGTLDKEHCLIRRAIERGVRKEPLGRAFKLSLYAINRRINLLEGICPEAIKLLQDHQFSPEVKQVLRNMKAARHMYVVELMITSNTITAAHADTLLKATSSSSAQT